MSSEKYEFKGRNGDMLAGRLEVPEGDVKAYAVFAHCFTCSKDFIASRTITQALAERGIATLRFDFTGIGNSEGDFGNTNFSSNVEDLILAANALGKTHQAPKLLIGHSLGGAATLAAAPYVESATAVATLAAPFDPSHVAHLFAEDIESIQQEGEADVDLFGRTFKITYDFIKDINQYNQRQHIAAMRKALMVMHSPTDQTVGIENAKMIYDAAQHPKSFITLDGMDHLLMNKGDVGYVANMLAGWATRYIDREPKKAVDPSTISTSDGSVNVLATGNGPFSMIVQSGPHTMLADEPLSVGGKDSGPTPYDFLLAAVGTCTAMTLKMYANHKKLKLEDVRVKLSQQRLHANDCEDCDTQEGYIHEITREITIKGNFTDEQRRKFLEIADKCPVHRTLESEVKIRSYLKE